MKLNIAIAFLYHPLGHDTCILSVVVLGFDYNTSAAQCGGGVDGEDHVGRYRLVHKCRFVVNINIITIIL